MDGKSKAFDEAAPGPIEPLGTRTPELSTREQHVSETGLPRRSGSLTDGRSTTRHGGRTWRRLTLALAGRALLRPRLVLDLARTVWAFRRRGWFRAPPFVPLPPPEYIRWRMYTAYGDEDAVPPPDDVIRFVQWRRRVMHL